MKTIRLNRRGAEAQRGKAKSQITKAELEEQLWDMHYEFGVHIGRVAEDILRLRRSRVWTADFIQSEFCALRREIWRIQGSLRRMNAANRKAVQDQARRYIRDTRAFANVAVVTKEAA